MKKLFLFGFMLSALAFPGAAQKDESRDAKTLHPPIPLRTFTLTGFWAEDGHGKLKRSEKADRNCFDFVSESEVRCRSRWDIVYGSMRAGEEWDWFYVPASGNARTRIVSLGKKRWRDLKSVPEVEPLPRLKPGEKRVVSVDASGAKGVDGSPGLDGAPGANGINGDGSVSLSQAEPPRPGPIVVRAPETPRKPVTTSEHLIRAVKGGMYVLRVVDDEHDFHVLIRVDDIVRGRTATISWMKLAEL